MRVLGKTGGVRRRWQAAPRWFAAASVIGVGGLSASVGAGLPSTHASKPAQYIVQTTTVAGANALVQTSGGKVLAQAGAIHSVLALLTPAQVAQITQHGAHVTPNMTIHFASVASAHHHNRGHDDGGPPPPPVPSGNSGTTTTVPDAPGGHGPTTTSTTTASTTTTVAPASIPTAPAHAPSTAFTQITGATTLWSQGDTGQGQTVAVLDTGIANSLPDFGSRVVDGVDLSGEANPYQDSYGHGTFVAGLIASNGASSNGQYTGEAPGADLVSIKVAGSSGVTSEFTVIQGVLWAIAHEKSDNISVLNLSLGVKPPSSAATDPLDLAVEAAWRSGIVVVTPSGNFGPDNGTITSPGDDPLVITVGALDDGGGTNPANFSIAPFSGVGPTLYDGFFKPDIVASGRSVISLVAPNSTVLQQNPSSLIGTANFVGSGTSFSTAITSGMAALVLEAHPQLKPDDVKARLLLTASPGPVGDPLVDGHGIANADHAVISQEIHLKQGGAIADVLLSDSTSLQSTWKVSTFNGAAWNGAAWNGAAWNGAAWNGAAWNGAAWNGSAWNGAAWNGAAWNGAAWNGAAWNGAAWNGAAWNGAAWNGAAWNGTFWNGAAWNGAAWNGAAWNGAAWNGAAWNGAAWNGAAWNGFFSS